jgi:hypothetical protein
MSVSKLGMISVASILSAWAQQVNVAPSGTSGIELIGSESPDFRSSIEAVIGEQAAAQLNPYLPLTVLLRNNSSQSLAGYYVQWSINGSRAGMGVGSLQNKDSKQYLKPDQGFRQRFARLAYQ